LAESTLGQKIRKSYQDLAAIPPMWLVYQPRMSNNAPSSDEELHSQRLNAIEAKLQDEIDRDYSTFNPS
jgi:hypothetical protein